MKREKRLLRMLLCPFWGGEEEEGGRGRAGERTCVIESRGPKGVTQNGEGRRRTLFNVCTPPSFRCGEEGELHGSGALRRRRKSPIQLLVNHALRRAEPQPELQGPSKVQLWGCLKRAFQVLRLPGALHLAIGVLLHIRESNFKGRCAGRSISYKGPSNEKVNKQKTAEGSTTTKLRMDYLRYAIPPRSTSVCFRCSPAFHFISLLRFKMSGIQTTENAASQRGASEEKREVGMKVSLGERVGKIVNPQRESSCCWHYLR